MKFILAHFVPQYALPRNEVSPIVVTTRDKKLRCILDKETGTMKHLAAAASMAAISLTGCDYYDIKKDRDELMSEVEEFRARDRLEEAAARAAADANAIEIKDELARWEELNSAKDRMTENFPELAALVMTMTDRELSIQFVGAHGLIDEWLPETLDILEVPSDVRLSVSSITPIQPASAFEYRNVKMTADISLVQSFRYVSIFQVTILIQFQST